MDELVFVVVCLGGAIAVAILIGALLLSSRRKW